MNDRFQSNATSLGEQPAVTIRTMHEGMAIPLDPNRFAEAFDVWAETEAQLPSSAATAALCIATTTQHLMNASVENIPPYMIRLMAIQQLYAAHEGVLSPFFKTADDGSLNVHLALIAAAATAKFIVTEDFVGFDLDDVARQAALYTAGAPDSKAIH